jgi:1,4-alpha-glucan branching enzyme
VIKRTLQRNRLKVRVQFILPETRVTSPEVSVVGEFNDWRQGATRLQRCDDGTRSASVTLETGRRYAFSYVGDDGRWYDEETADSAEPDGRGGWNSVLRT